MDKFLKTSGIVFIAMLSSIVVRFTLEHGLDVEPTIAANSAGFVFGMIFARLIYREV